MISMSKIKSNDNSRIPRFSRPVGTLKDFYEVISRLLSGSTQYRSNSFKTGETLCRISRGYSNSAWLLLLFPYYTITCLKSWLVSINSWITFNCWPRGEKSECMKNSIVYVFCSYIVHNWKTVDVTIYNYTHKHNLIDLDRHTC